MWLLHDADDVVHAGQQKVILVCLFFLFLLDWYIFVFGSFVSQKHDHISINKKEAYSHPVLVDCYQVQLENKVAIV